MKWILPLLALLYMSATANDVSHSAKLDFIKGKKFYNQEDYVNASKSYARACNKGLSDVCNTLAFMYIDGKIVMNHNIMVWMLGVGCTADNALSCMLLASTHKGVYSSRSDKEKATQAKTKGCKLLKDSKPYWKAQESMEKWNCFAKIEPEVEVESEVTTSSEVYVDSSTGLMWQDNSDARTLTKNWHSAKSYCKYLSLAGHSDWYLPDKEQLLKLSKLNAELQNTTASYYWSATAFEDNDFGAWGVHMRKQRDDWGEKSGESYVRCVRGEVEQVKSYDTQESTYDDSFSDVTYATEYVEEANDYTLVFKNKCDESIYLAYKVKKENGYETSYSLKNITANNTHSIRGIIEKKGYFYAEARHANVSWHGEHRTRLGNGKRYKFRSLNMKIRKKKGTHIISLTCGSNTFKTYKIIKIPSNDTLNVRRDAGTHNTRIDEIAYNARGIKVIRCKKAPNGRKWCKIKHYSISTGWVSAKYLKLQ